MTDVRIDVDDSNWSKQETRISRETMFMRWAQHAADRSTCRRAHVGAVLTDGAGVQVFSYGYNGAPRGLPNRCARDIEGNCGCVHAELNALLKAPGNAWPGTLVLYTTTAPCENCARMILNSAVGRVVYLGEYRSRAGAELLLAGGIALQAYDGGHEEPL